LREKPARELFLPAQSGDLLRTLRVTRGQKKPKARIEGPELTEGLEDFFLLSPMGAPGHPEGLTVLQPETPTERREIGRRLKAEGIKLKVSDDMNLRLRNSEGAEARRVLLCLHATERKASKGRPQEGCGEPIGPEGTLGEAPIHQGRGNPLAPEFEKEVRPELRLGRHKKPRPDLPEDVSGHRMEIDRKIEKGFVLAPEPLEDLASGEGGG